MTNAPATQTFETPVGRIIAHRRDHMLEALGVPYARAQRFKFPVAVEARDFADPFDAYQPAPAAPQHIRGGASSDIRQSAFISEDCQNLSIIMPANVQPGERLPVMVYFHGGSYVVGSGDGARYNPDAFLREHRVIIVRVTYRLGILGFLGGTTERPANLGLLDAREALRWVKNNIASFGGDANNITAFGQSAGGDLIARLLISEGVIEEELLHKVIIQSAPLNLIFGKEKMAAAMLRKVEHELAADAPAKDYGELGYKMQIQNVLKYGVDISLMAFGTQLGHYPLPAAQDLDAAYARVAEKVQVLIGAAERESAYFAPGKLRGASLKAVEPVVHRYATKHYLEPAQEFADRHRKAGGDATCYTLRTGHPLNRLASAHCTDLALLFNNPSWKGSNLFAGAYPWEYEPQAQALRAIWATFAATGEVRKELAQQGRITLS